MAEITIAADFGASLGRAIYSTSPNHSNTQLILLDPPSGRRPRKKH